MPTHGPMPTITRIATSKRRPHRRSLFLDGRFAFACHVNVIARFRLRVGQDLTADQLREIEQGQVRQEAFDAATRLMRSRLQATAEQRQKLLRKEGARGTVE